MPEGDTIFRTAAAIRKWIGGRVVTAARSDVSGVRAEELVGRTVTEVRAVGKHLLMQFDSDDGESLLPTLLPPLLLRTHMLMMGSWHVYSRGAAWQRPTKQARIVIEAGDRLAVGFNIPVLELSAESAQFASGVAHLGPDVLMPSFGATAVIPRVRRLPADRAIGEVLLDQTVVAGIGNIYRCESLYIERINPWMVQGMLSSAQLVELLETASKLMKQNLEPAKVSRNLDAGASQTWVYRRANRPCRTCATPILSRAQGPQTRTAYWCPTCQL
jgi:endonuclease VIII